MSNSRPVSETELDSNSEYETEHTTNKGTHNTGSSNTTKGLVTQPEYEHTTTEIAQSQTSLKIRLPNLNMNIHMCIALKP